MFEALARPWAFAVPRLKLPGLKEFLQSRVEEEEEKEAAEEQQ